MSAVGWAMVVASASAVLSVVAVLVGVIARQQAYRAGRDAAVARTSAGDADRSARFAAGRARAMAEHRPMIEAVLVDWGLRPDRARQVVRELRDRVAAELAAQGRVDRAAVLTSERARRWQEPRDGGPPASATRAEEAGSGPSGTRRGRPAT